MPLPKSARRQIDTRKVFLSAHAMSGLVGCHRHTILRALARGDIEPDGFLDANGTLQPIFHATAAIELARLILPPHDAPPRVIA